MTVDDNSSAKTRESATKWQGKFRDGDVRVDEIAWTIGHALKTLRHWAETSGLIGLL
jgi:hypothetical protein